MTGVEEDGPVDVSVVVCTRNRAERLRRAVESIRRSLDHATEAGGLTCELLLVDNGSTDGTRELIESLVESDHRVRACTVPVPGIARARNGGLDGSRGRVVLFTDDDTVVPQHWVRRMSEPLLEGRADAVAGGVVMAEGLRRPWMTEELRSKYYADVPVPPEVSPGMAGANMAITRSVAQCFRFDEELGTARYPGAEDVLFYSQILEAGLRVRGVPDAPVEHHFDPVRLDPGRLEQIAAGYGRCDAFYFHHWLHASLRAQHLRLWLHRAELAVRRGLARGNRFDEDVIRLRREVAFHAEMLALRGTPRRYSERGLLRIEEAA